MGLNTYAIEQAVSRTGAQDLGELRTMLAQVGKVYAGQIPTKDAALAAKDETIATKEQVITTQRAALAKTEQSLAADALAIVELRRRAEQAETERDSLAAAQAAQDAPGATAAPTPDNPSSAPPQGFWARVRRVFGGE